MLLLAECRESTSTDMLPSNPAVSAPAAAQTAGRRRPLCPASLLICCSPTPAHVAVSHN
jgi:hypothetical protein